MCPTLSETEVDSRYVQKRKGKSRRKAVDPDPHSLSLLDPDQGGKISQIIKKCEEIGNNCKFI